MIEKVGGNRKRGAFMKRLTGINFLIVMMLVCTSCTAMPSNPQQEDSSSFTSFIAADLSNEKIPLQNENYYFSFEDALPQDLPPQLIEDNETAYRLSLTVSDFLFYGGNRLDDFDEKTKENAEGVLETAIFHTTPLNLNYSYGVGEGFVCEDYPNHAITKLVERLVRDGRDPTAIFYADDVKDTAEKLFGQAVKYKDADVAFYGYFPEKKVYVQFGELSGPRLPYPQITSYSKTEQGYTCDAVLVAALDKDTPITIDDITLTKENFEELTSKNEKYRYTFTKQTDGIFILTGLKTLK